MSRWNLWELKYALQDIKELLDLAGKMAYEISEDEPGRAADPEYNIPAEPAVEGWPLMLHVCDELGKMGMILGALRENPELVKAIADEKAELDDLSDRADALSY